MNLFYQVGCNSHLVEGEDERLVGLEGAHELLLRGADDDVLHLEHVVEDLERLGLPEERQLVQRLVDTDQPMVTSAEEPLGVRDQALDGGGVRNGAWDRASELAVLDVVHLTLGGPDEQALLVGGVGGEPSVRDAVPRRLVLAQVWAQGLQVDVHQPEGFKNVFTADGEHGLVHGVERDLIYRVVAFIGGLDGGRNLGLLPHPQNQIPLRCAALCREVMTTWRKLHRNHRPRAVLFGLEPFAHFVGGQIVYGDRRFVQTLRNRQILFGGGHRHRRHSTGFRHQWNVLLRLVFGIIDDKLVGCGVHSQLLTDVVEIILAIALQAEDVPVRMEQGFSNVSFGSYFARNGWIVQIVHSSVKSDRRNQHAKGRPPASWACRGHYLW
eukprot:7441631-Pyramimonas_sp.AAC.1